RDRGVGLPAVACALELAEAEADVIALVAVGVAVGAARWVALTTAAAGRSLSGPSITTDVVPVPSAKPSSPMPITVRRRFRSICRTKRASPRPGYAAPSGQSGRRS